MLQGNKNYALDFRKLNDLTIGDSFPLPNITDILDQLGNAKYFSTLDLASGYHQIPMHREHRNKTAFSIPYGHFEFNRMPFGLKNAPATFQRLMNSVQGLKCLVYLDDIVIYGPNLKEHNKRLIQVLDRLREHNLKLQPEKCEFLQKEVVHLGHIITENGIRPDPSKLYAVEDFPVPRKVKDVQSFLGLAGYYRKFIAKFIADFSKIAKPLTKLTKKGEKFNWTAEQQNSFQSLKEKLTTAPVLKYPDFQREFLVTTDASDYAIGVLSQGPVGQNRPITYASRILCKAKQNYNTTEKSELLAIVWAVKYFRLYLYGTRFKIVTDHRPLIWLFNITDPGSILIRWRLKLEEYDEIVHKAGKGNTNADALSRNPIPDNQHLNSISQKKEEEEEQEEEEQEEEAPKEYTEEEKRQILYEYHDAPTGGHQGIARTMSRIRLEHNWRGITRGVEEYISKCEYCQRNKLSQKTKIPLTIMDTPTRPFEKCALNIVGPLTVTTNGNKYILTFQDNLTKFSKAIPLANQKAVTVAK